MASGSLTNTVADKLAKDLVTFTLKQKGVSIKESGNEEKKDNSI
jgi:hypothetical protein